MAFYGHSRSKVTHAMKNLLLLTLLFLFIAIYAYGQTVSCPDAKPQQNQYRGDVKHRAPGRPRGE